VITKHTLRISSYEEFTGNKMAVDAVLRNLEIIGEAVKNVPPEVKKKYPKVEWKKIAGLRDILAHSYFGVDSEVVWDILKNNLPKFMEEITSIDSKKTN
jgi:uncharacterized protein with HEPN domain